MGFFNYFIRTCSTPRFARGVLLLALSSVAGLNAQDRAAISGSVTDASGALVAAAAIELKSNATGILHVTATSDRGLYEVDALPVGAYTITITKAGFKPTTVDQVDLQYGETRTDRRAT